MTLICVFQPWHPWYFGLQVVCRQLGFLSTGAVAYRNVHFGYGNGYMYSLLGIQCWQLEPYITDCVNDWYHLLVPACWPSSPGAGVSCQGEYPYNSLVPRSVQKQGVVTYMLPVCRSYCNQDQMESSDQWSWSRDQEELWTTNINRSTHFLRY